MIRHCIVQIEGDAAYTQSRQHETPKLDGELPKDYEIRTWMNKAHLTDDGDVYIPAMALSKCIKEAAQFMNKKIPGKRNETWTKHFGSGIHVMRPGVLKGSGKRIRCLVTSVPPDGKPGGKARVTKMFPTVDDPWATEFEVQILDDLITPEIFSEVMHVAGTLIGIGTFRVRNNSTHGRFHAVGLQWTK